MKKTVQLAHDRAVETGESAYIDPETGYRVFTSLGLQRRGQCCGCGCRHCPFHHAAVPTSQKAARIRNPAWMTEPDPAAELLLFWSGGKDSFLALRALERSHPETRIALMTTFDGESRKVAHQEVPINAVVDQANALGRSLIGVPLYGGSDYVQQITSGLTLVPALTALAFGDLHLEHIRTWREEAFSELVTIHGYKLLFPLWQMPYDTLLADLEASGVDCLISAVTLPSLENLLGTPFTKAFIASLPDGVDTFGENGEFHTRLIPPG